MATQARSKADEAPSEDLGRRLRRFRRGRNLAQTELAQKAGISVDTISKIELGHHERPHPQTLRKLAEALQVGEEDLTGGIVTRR